MLESLEDKSLKEISKALQTQFPPIDTDPLYKDFHRVDGTFRWTEAHVSRLDGLQWPQTKAHCFGTQNHFPQPYAVYPLRRLRMRERLLASSTHSMRATAFGLGAALCTVPTQIALNHMDTPLALFLIPSALMVIPFYKATKSALSSAFSALAQLPYNTLAVGVHLTASDQPVRPVIIKANKLKF